jgi:hypothetical protein
MRSRPNPTLHHVLEGRHRKLQPKHFAEGSSIDKIAVTRVRLKLHPEIGTRRTDVEAVRKRLDLKMLPHQIADLADLVDRYDKIKIEAERRFDVSVDGLATKRTSRP